MLHVLTLPVRIFVPVMMVILVMVECALTSMNVTMERTTVLQTHHALIRMAVSHVFVILDSKVTVLPVKISMNVSMVPTNVIPIQNAQTLLAHMTAVVTLDSKVTALFVPT